MHYFIKTYGCQMNVYDSEVLAGHLESMGYSPTDDEEKADILIINTCAVRQKAEEKVYSRLGRLVNLKEKKEGMMLVLWGCIAQQEGAARQIKERFPFVDLICGPQALGRFPELLQKATVSPSCVIDTDLTGERECLPVKRGDSFKAWVPISHGCNNYCTYCVVPYVRGPEKSRLPEHILEEVEELAREGYKEITLLGQNVNSFGKDLQIEYDFADLLRDVDRVKELQRVRFMTSHPRDFTEKIVRAVIDGEKVCEHFHLPLQSGSNRILKAMNRGYSREVYRELIKLIKKLSPGSAVTTDIIVGFPGESEADFMGTLEMVKEIRFDAAYNFVYSPRKGTAAAEMKGQVDKETKTERIILLNKIQNRISLEKNRELIGTKQEVLVEGRSKNNPDMYTGRTRTNKIVHFASPENMVGKMLTVGIVEAKPWTLTGKHN